MKAKSPKFMAVSSLLARGNCYLVGMTPGQQFGDAPRERSHTIKVQFSIQRNTHMQAARTRGHRQALQAEKFKDLAQCERCLPHGTKVLPWRIKIKYK